MDVCHLLLGRPWEFDRRIQHDAFLNTYYTFQMDNHTFTMKPSLPWKPPVPLSPIILLQRTPFKAAMCDKGVVMLLLSTPVALSSSPIILPAFTALMNQSADVFPEDLPPRLPPLRDIQHRIDLVPDASLPNRLHYCMSSNAHEELHKQVEILITKGFL